MKKTNPLKVMYLILAFVFLGIGMVGVILPVLPTTPFLLVASCCFAKGSEKFYRWFTSTKVYANHLESFVQNKAMTRKTKISIMIPASAMLFVAMLLVPNMHARIAIGIVWIFKIYYFICRIKTIEESVENV